ncbi:UNVERIFIED_CONTAM: hypothetical protein Sradi_5069400 [Sesamum radiatum]|uniref:Uncharacterized protein n=1 Tax=Sesamum radiatum TaxID=300843 RepID=A0AAW2M4S9_SESRA
MTVNKIPAFKILASSSNESIRVITRGMPKKLQAHFEITFHEVVGKDLLHLVEKNEGDGDLKVESSSSTPRSTLSATPIMVTNATTLEEQIANLTRAIEGLTKHVEEQDSQINKLVNKMENTNSSYMVGKQDERLRQKSNKREKLSIKELQFSSEWLIPVDQLKKFIMETIKDKLDGSSKSSITYTDPYTQRIDDLKMLFGYQPPKFQYFDSKGNSKQCATHFIVMCNNAEGSMEITS